MHKWSKHREQAVQSKGKYRCTDIDTLPSSAVEICQRTLPLSVKTQELYSLMLKHLIVSLRCVTSLTLKIEGKKEVVYFCLSEFSCRQAREANEMQ